MEISANKTTALVGETGCGKSTVLQLIEKFYNPVEGSIHIDGIPLADFAPRVLRSKMGLVSQEPVLFSSTIEENVRYGSLDATKDEIEDACRRANALQFIEEQEKGLKTFVGAGGSQLSGGQKQRIAIARALIKKPAILLFDEATSSLDRRNEQMIQEAVNRISGSVTTIIVAHRLSTIQEADKIVVLKSGKVEEEGTHSDLLQIRGVYANLVKFQQEKSTKELEDGLSTDAEGVEDTKSTIDARAKKTGSESNMKAINVDVTDSEPTPRVKDNSQKSVVTRVLHHGRHERSWLVLGVFMAFLSALTTPVFAVIFALYIDTLVEGESDDDFRKEANLYSILLALFAVFAGVFLLSQQYALSRSGEGLTYHLRLLSFTHMLKMNTEWFDRKENQTGALTTKLSTESTLVHKLVGPTLGTFLQASIAIGVGSIIAFAFSWQLALLGLALSPLFIFCGIYSAKAHTGYEMTNQEAVEISGSVLSEALSNIRTLLSLNIKEKIANNFMEKLQGTIKGIARHGVKSALTMGLGYIAPFFFYTMCLLFGAYLIDEGEITFEDLSLAMFAIAFGAHATGQFVAAMPDLTTSRNAANSIFKMEDTESAIDPFDQSGRVLESSQVTGRVVFRDVVFQYPQRDNMVLNGFNLTLEPGKKLALVGRSGCGKSTTVQLLLRFYNVQSGSISLDGVAINEINIGNLRSHIGLVSQEPVLFNTTIENNIKFGNSAATMVEVRQAAVMANALEFIEGPEIADSEDVKEGFQRVVGPKGEKLSGGQKQRIAIARAIIRNPKVLLLDEATSALDAQSEDLVQSALNRCMEGKSTIVIAHRLNTIEFADKICVIDEGRVREEGKHDELMEKHGLYYNLIKAL
eukprot:CAMPEP_0115007348 /NCGR_PEP_ID=MMETSP0216-20121206/21116_1 /TAXON_ID=223996 /ORGANISM="Protocruzia adherens, Strain Boccale" /LENGTH=863 /DNA_ID=CAMNT_0002374253 /DNA_START=126 /DNA_END=2717 /DNA_ORIENTATION=-